jgi:hypothetical protein
MTMLMVVSEIVRLKVGGLDPEAIETEVRRRWPNLTDDEIGEQFEAAAERLQAEAEAKLSEADALQAELRRRRDPMINLIRK